MDLIRKHRPYLAYQLEKLGCQDRFPETEAEVKALKNSLRDFTVRQEENYFGVAPLFHYETSPAEETFRFLLFLPHYRHRKGREKELSILGPFLFRLRETQYTDPHEKISALERGHATAESFFFSLPLLGGIRAKTYYTPSPEREILRKLIAHSRAKEPEIEREKVDAELRKLSPALALPGSVTDGESLRAFLADASTTCHLPVRTEWNGGFLPLFFKTGKDSWVIPPLLSGWEHTEKESSFLSLPLLTFVKESREERVRNILFPVGWMESETQNNRDTAFVCEADDILDNDSYVKESGFGVLLHLYHQNENSVLVAARKGEAAHLNKLRSLLRVRIRRLNELARTEKEIRSLRPRLEQAVAKQTGKAAVLPDADACRNTAVPEKGNLRIKLRCLESRYREAAKLREDLLSSEKELTGEWNALEIPADHFDMDSVKALQSCFDSLYENRIRECMVRKCGTWFAGTENAENASHWNIAWILADGRRSAGREESPSSGGSGNAGQSTAEPADTSSSSPTGNDRSWQKKREKGRNPSPVGHIRAEIRSDTEVDHRVGDLAEARDIGAEHVVVRLPEFRGDFMRGIVNALHDVVKSLVNLLGTPSETDRVLAHLQSAGGDAAGVGGLARAEENVVFQEDIGRADRGGHVRAFGNADAAVLHKLFGVALIQFVLGRAGKRDVGFRQFPRTLAFIVGRALEDLRIFGDSAAADILELHDIGELFGVDTVLVDDRSVGVGHRKDLSAELERLLHGILRNVSGTGNKHLAPLKGGAACLEHFGCEVDVSVTGGLRTDQTSAPVQPLSGQDAVIAVDDFLVLAEHVADFAAADADVSGGNVRIRADVAVEFAHERLAEHHDLMLGFPLGIEVRAALSAAHREGGQAVLEDLLESEELEDAQRHRGTEAKSALVRADGAVELDAVSVIDLDFAFVVNPRDLEGNDPFRNGDAFEDLVLLIPGIHIEDLAQGFKNLRDTLKELRLPRSGVLQVFQHTLRIGIHRVSSPCSL